MPTHEVLADVARGVVWVNAADGSCIGRFSKQFGVDVHTTATAQMEGAGQCLVCTHGKADRQAWELFVHAMAQHYGVTVNPMLLPWPQDELRA